MVSVRDASTFAYHSGYAAIRSGRFSTSRMAWPEDTMRFFSVTLLMVMGEAVSETAGVHGRSSAEGSETMLTGMPARWLQWIPASMELYDAQGP